MTAEDQTHLTQKLSPITHKINSYPNPGQDSHFWNHPKIRNIMGYPVIKPIYDREGQLILDVGDLITYSTVQRAKDAGMLEQVLKAVYYGKS